jgi:hypothetical protein
MYTIVPFVIVFSKAINIGILKFLVKSGFSFVNSLFDAFYKNLAPEVSEISTLLSH